MKYWHGEVKTCNICKEKLSDVMYDSNTRMGWANTCEACFREYGTGLGTGRGQKYERQADDRWLKTAG